MFCIKKNLHLASPKPGNYWPIFILFICMSLSHHSIIWQQSKPLCRQVVSLILCFLLSSYLFLVPHFTRTNRCKFSFCFPHLFLLCSHHDFQLSASAQHCSQMFCSASDSIFSVNTPPPQLMWPHLLWDRPCILITPNSQLSSLQLSLLTMSTTGTTHPIFVGISGVPWQVSTQDIEHIS